MHKLTFWSGVGSVTGANFELEGPQGRLLVDCGLVQGAEDEMVANARPFPYDPSGASALFVTHAHIDHIGRIPKLVRDGFEGTIYSHPATKRLAEVMLPDALKLMETECAERGLKPFYSAADVAKAVSLWETLDYGETLDVLGYKVRFRNAGHVLGSAMIEIKADKTLLFTGDLGNCPSLLLPDADTAEGADYLVMESVYGDRNHEGKGERSERLGEIVSEAIGRGGTLLIPAFSLERTQMVLYELNELIESKRARSVPVFVDSPLATKVTDIYREFSGLFKEEVREDIRGGDDVFSFPKLKFTVERRESEEIARVADPKIIIAGSGMSMGGRVISHEARLLSDPKSTVLLVGYQTLGSLGRRLEEGAKRVTIRGRDIKVRACVEAIKSYSSHMDSDHLVEFAESGSATLKKVFVTMGEPKASVFLAQHIRDYAGLDAVYPERGKAYEIDL